MAPDTLSLQGKIALVTGSGRENSIGGAIIKTLASNGASVIIHHVSPSVAPRAQALAAHCLESGAPKAVVVQGDISSLDGAQAIVKEALAALGAGNIDILVNSAGVWHPITSMEATPEIIQQEFATNVFGAVYMVKSVLPHINKGGRIINIGSVASRVGVVEAGIYAATKAALDSLTFTWAAEFGISHNITVNVLGPGAIRTDMTVDDPADNFDRKKATQRAGTRDGTPQDVADAALLLCSEKSRWITGQYIDVSGGIVGAV